MSKSNFPLLYQVNTRVWLTEMSASLGRNATLDDIPDQELEKFRAEGFDWIWLLSIWQTGLEGQRISRTTEAWRKEFIETLPDLKEEDIAGSGFAISCYTVSEILGGNEALARLRKRMNEKGLKLMLDFVPNHVAPDHHWIDEHPDYFIRGSSQQIEKEPVNYACISTKNGEIIIAKGRDPYFPGWPDTLQLNYGSQGLQEAMKNELAKIAAKCDGVRCDMAMLILPEVFNKTWGINCKNFWPDAIRRAREVNEKFCMLAEVYWDMEWTMIQQGFDYAYDKRLYDRLKEGRARPVREHFQAGTDYQSHMARFLENHDEPRAAIEFSNGKHEAAAVLTYLSPGLRFFHQGQLTGNRKRIPAHLVRGPHEKVNEAIQQFYNKILEILRQPVFRQGQWQLLECLQAWESNWTHINYITAAWRNGNDERLIVAVNYSQNRSQCYVRFPFAEQSTGTLLLTDLISGNVFERSAEDLNIKGLYLDEPGWKTYVFTVREKVL